MNTLYIYPKPLRESYINNFKKSGITGSIEMYHQKRTLIMLVIVIISLVLLRLFGESLYYSILVFCVLETICYMRVSLQAASRIAKIEEVFPDFISLMASNLKSGVTIDKAFLMSARPEFEYLHQIVLEAGREINTGREIVEVLEKMKINIGSEKISNILSLIISGIESGGQLSELLEQTARNIREREAVEKKATSLIQMYVVFIFFAVAVGAPLLFALSSILIEVVMALSSKMPEVSSVGSAPFTFNKISVSLDFIMTFSVIFIVVSDLISSMIIGMINKGKAKEGLKTFFPLLLVSLGIFYLVRIFLSSVIVEMITGSI